MSDKSLKVIAPHICRPQTVQIVHAHENWQNVCKKINRINVYSFLAHDIAVSTVMVDRVSLLQNAKSHLKIWPLTL